MPFKVSALRPAIRIPDPSLLEHPTSFCHHSGTESTTALDYDLPSFMCPCLVSKQLTCGQLKASGYVWSSNVTVCLGA